MSVLGDTIKVNVDLSGFTNERAWASLDREFRHATARHKGTVALVLALMKNGKSFNDAMVLANNLYCDGYGSILATQRTLGRFPMSADPEYAWQHWGPLRRFGFKRVEK